MLHDNGDVAIVVGRNVGGWFCHPSADCHCEGLKTVA